MACICANLLFPAPSWASDALASGGARQILFVEDNIADYRQLAAADMDVIVLDGRQDGLRQIAQALDSRRDIGALHLVSHGRPAALQLGSLQLGRLQLHERSADLDRIRAALRPDADILLYGCNVAEGKDGQAFIGELASRTGARVAASTNLTGDRAQGGDWLLESRTAPLRSAALAFPGYRHVLPSVAGTMQIPFGQADTAFSSASIVDGQAGTGSTNIPNVVYEFYFADTGNTGVGQVRNLDLTGGTGSMFLFYNAGQYGAVGSLIVKAQSDRSFGLSSFRIQDAQAIASTYTLTGYRNGVLTVAGWTFNVGGSTNPVTILPPAQFTNVDELRITSNGGTGGVGAKLYQEGFNSFVFTEPTANASLTALSTTAAALSPVFASTTTTYNMSVGNATASTTVTPTVDTPGTTVTVNGATVASGAASGSIALNVGANAITTIVTALDGSTTATYTINITRAAPPSSDANLSNLVLSTGTLTPVFAAGTTSYTAGVPFTTTSMTVTPTRSDAGATITVNGVTVISGSASGALALNVGANTITTIVTAADSSTKTYTTTVTRAAASGDNQLSALSLSSGTLAPVFASGTTSYTASVGNATTSLTVTPTVADATASITVNGVATTSGNASGAIALAIGSNTITVTVTAQNGTPLSYTITATRAASANADLSALSLSSGTLSPAFASATTSYTASVGNATTSLTLTPTVQDANASVTVNGVATTSGNASGAIALAVGANTITTIVTAQDGSTTKTYTVTVTRAASSNNDLSALSLSSGTLSPAFNPAATSYAASISAGVSSITVTPTVADATASVTVNGVAVTSGAASGAIAMNPGNNTVTVVVTAQNSATKSYTVTITRALPSTNADLSALSLSSGTLSPAFASATTGYTASVANATSSLTVTPTVQDATASVTVNGVATTSGNASGAIALAVGANTITTIVTAQDGSSTKTYTVTVTRAGSGDANLSALVLSGGSLSPAFAPSTTSYTMAIAAATSSITVTPTVNEANATVTVNGVAVASGNASAPIAMNTGSNTVTVVVTAQNSSTKTYTVTVTRAISTNNELAALALSNGTLNPVFSPAQQSYSATVPNATASITVTPTVADSSAAVTVNGVAVTSGAASGAIALNTGANLITVVVTAQDGSPRSYLITVTRNASSNADLAALTISAGTLNPVFSGATTSYTATVPNSTTSLTVTPTATSAIIMVNGVATASGSASAPLALNVGNNVITIVVTAQDGVTTNTYTVNLTRAVSPVAELSGLAVSNAVLTPAFSPATLAYGASVGNAVTAVTVTPSAAAGSITVNGLATASGNASAPIVLAVGANAVSVVVTAPDGLSSKTYSITVNRAGAGNADLAALAAPGLTFTPAFAPGITSYSLAVPNASASIALIPTAADSNASIGVNGVAVASGASSAPIALAVGANAVQVSVTAQNGTVKTYTVSVTRAASADATLSKLVLSAGELSPAFSAATRAYTVAVPNASASLTITPTVLDASASVSINGVAVASASASAPLALAVGSNTITIVTTAQDGSKISTTITVTRAAPPSASLAGLVYNDSNHDGVKDGNESGLAGVTVKLGGTDLDGVKVDLSTVSGADGRFAFETLKGGTYTLSEVQPSGKRDGKETAGNLGGTVDNSGFDDSAARNRIAHIVVAPGAVGSGYLFGEQNIGTLQGFVYVDANDNGVKDNGETGLAGVRITLSGSASAVATSGADGSFAFPGISAGSYALSRNPGDLDGARYADGREHAGAAGGTVNDSSFGTQAYQVSISAIGIDGAAIASGKLDGYLFGLRQRGVAGLKLPIVSGTIMLSSKPTPGHSGAGLLDGWNVNLSQNGQSICSVLSNGQGQYTLNNLVCPGYEERGLPTGDGFALQFSKAGSTLGGTADSGGNAGSGAFRSIRNLRLSASDEITQQNLALDPAGVVYDALSRQPLAGASVSVSGPAGFDPATHLAGGAAAQSQLTGNDGAYQYLLQNGFPSGTYTLTVTRAPAGYSTESALLPACAGTLDVGASPNPAFVQSSDAAPGASVARHDAAACSGLVQGGAASTQYYLKLQISNGVSAPILNNHIPLDAAVAAGLSLSKSGDRQTAELGDTVRYTIVLRQGAGSVIRQASVRDVLPAGFRFIPGSVTLNGVRAADPVQSAGALLGFKLGAAAGGRELVLVYRVRVGVGSMQGDGVNRARAYACNSADGCLDAALTARAGSVASNEASFKVKVSGGVFTNDACVAGKVFADCNRNGIQDAGEAGIPALRLYLEDGTNITTDADGKYSYCGLSPTSHVIKVDPLTLPSGSVLGETSNRNLGDPDSLLLDVRNGELIRADFAETSCAAPVLERIKRPGSPPSGLAPPAAGSPGITFSSKVKSKVNNATKQGEHHAH
ncbi:cadherin-like beta sandwich domain-containing protein [Massilia sp. DJPM01]|uniref:cadherin-like beta sandwich domain-containing protein n=1 Tax=Massilia sp. DJPM01 TaxID=3024404 RepID=UPI00259E9EBB|nr:cadherin-like beta sandwich domain-containing protein [Massilia sp. DJPM01]MDM5179578.1 cadherin-like beta sandwich domain-containing protein [Massilia sp. DJPM01]